MAARLTPISWATSSWVKPSSRWSLTARKRSSKVNVTCFFGGPPLGAEVLFLFFSIGSFSCMLTLFYHCSVNRFPVQIPLTIWSLAHPIEIDGPSYAWLRTIARVWAEDLPSL